MKKLSVLRGVSGSGKSTKAKELLKARLAGTTGVICSTDEFFIDPDTGNYNFDVKLLSKAHSWNRGRVWQAMQMGTELVVLDNTNTRHSEFKEYVEFAEQFGYEVEKITVGQLDESNLKAYANRNRHGVPLEVIRKQAKRFEK